MHVLSLIHQNPTAEGKKHQFVVGTVPAQLISRHWVITDGNSRIQEVRGLGVVGQQPLLKLGETFEYTSGRQPDTPVGSIYGGFQIAVSAASKPR